MILRINTEIWAFLSFNPKLKFAYNAELLNSYMKS